MTRGANPPHPTSISSAPGVATPQPAARPRDRGRARRPHRRAGRARPAPGADDAPAAEHHPGQLHRGRPPPGRRAGDLGLAKGHAHSRSRCAAGGAVCRRRHLHAGAAPGARHHRRPDRDLRHRRRGGLSRLWKGAGGPVGEQVPGPGVAQPQPVVLRLRAQQHLRHRQAGGEGRPWCRGAAMVPPPRWRCRWPGPGRLVRCAGRAASARSIRASCGRRHGRGPGRREQ
jgi:hypothetical protein